MHEVNFFEEPNKIEGLFFHLKGSWANEFIGSFSNFIKMFVPDISVQPVVDDTRLIGSGVAILVGITGQYSGKLVFDLSMILLRKTLG